jgi:uncharacterized RDD family membrane protein YckC
VATHLERMAAYAQTQSEDSTSAFGDLDVTVTFRRILAGLFDLAPLCIVFISLLRTYGLVRHRFIFRTPLYPRIPMISKYWIMNIATPTPTALMLFLAIVISYFTVFEASFGWTPGKLLFGIRVVDFYGGIPTVGQALTRNVFRILDAYPFVVPNLVGMTIILSNRRRQRGGDKAAGTLVVDRSAHSAIRALHRWQQQKAAAELSLPDEVWN